MKARLLFARTVAGVAAVALVGATLAAGANPAAASSGPLTPHLVTVHKQAHVICRAYGGSLSANAEADQDLGYSVTYPTGVHAGDTFSIKIRPDVSLYPRTDNSSGVLATINYIYNQVTSYALPSTLTINTVALGPINGNVEANPDAGYFVDKADVPTTVSANGSTVVDPTFDPLALDASKRLAIPGTAPSAYWNTSTNRVYSALLGSAGASGFVGGSVLQAPTLTLNVTAVADPGTDIQIKLGGQLPGSEPRNYAGTQPANFPAPASTATFTSTAATAPWASTDGLRYVYNDSVWTDPTYLNTTNVFALVTVTAKAACGPGWESTTTFPTPPSYYAGPTAIANGTSPALSDTYVVPYLKTTAPFEGAKYLTGQTVNANYECLASLEEGYDSCVGDVANGASINTSAPGSYTFTINGTDAYNAPLSKTVHYTVANALPPVANAGGAQTGKVAGTVVTLDGSASSDPNGIPALALTYNDATGLHPAGPSTFTWTQTSGPPVTLSDAHAVKPTFTVPVVDNPSGYTFGFSLLVNNSALTNTASTTVTSPASTPTVVAPTRARVGGGSTFFVGDKVTLSVAITNPDGTNPADYSYNWVQSSGIPTALSSNTAANPTYIIPTQNQTTGCTSGTASATANCPQWRVTVTKTNTNKSSSQSPSSGNYAAGLPTRPVADAGPAQNAPNAGGTITLNGTGSTQANSHPLSYAWTQTAGPAVTLSDATAASPTFTSPAGVSTLTFSLVVTDAQSPITGSGTNGNTSLAATTTVTVVPNHVVATASGTPTSGVSGTPVTLNGSASTDPNLAPLTYTWTQVSNGAPPVTLSNPNAANPTFTAPNVTTPGGYTAQFNLSVTNGGPNPADSDTTTTPVSITIAASTPTVAAPTKARAGGGASFFAGDNVTLSVAITNPDGTADADYSYVWVQTSGVPTTLSSTTVAHPTFIMPVQTNGTAACTSGTASATANCPEWKVTVTKTNTGKASLQSASLANYAAALATRPVANAGTAQNVKVTTSPVTLDGSASTQAQGHPLTYAWTQTAGPAVTLSSTTNQTPTFTAPNAATSLTFQLIVTDPQNPVAGNGTSGKVSTASTVTITVSDYAAPIASAGGDQTVTGGTNPVTLDASGSSQADNHTLTYSWTQTAGPAVTLSSTTAQKPTFTAPNVGTVLMFHVTVTDTQNPNAALASTTSADVSITVTDFLPPVASAGPNQSVHVADVVTLDASGSTQANGHTLAYSWTRTSGPSVTLSNAAAQKPTFTAPIPGAVLTFQVTVTDTQNPNAATASTTSSDVTITVNDYGSPVANAGPDQVVPGASVVTLDASGSSQVDAHTLSYAWTQTAGTAVSLSDATAQKPTFTASVSDGDVKFTVTVTDTQNPNPAVASSTSSEVTITVSNLDPPVADAGPDQTVGVTTDPVTLDASGSSQADNHVLTYLWSQTAGTPVTLSDATALHPTFTAPNAGTVLKFTVTVTDTQNPNGTTNHATSSEVTITVTDQATPIASAGPNQTVVVADPVTLDASGSSQADNHVLTYLWSQTAGTPVTLSDATALHPTFTAPNAGTVLKFTVTVTDTQNPNPAVASATSSAATITVADYASPVVSAGADQSVDAGAPVTLTGSASQADSHILSYSWTQTSGPAVTLSDPSALSPTFTAPGSAATLTFTMTASDSQNPNPAAASTTSIATTVTVNPVVVTGPKASVGDVTVVEGTANTRSMSFRVTLTQPATSQVTVHYTITGDSATKAAKKGTGVDVVAKASGSLVFKLRSTGTTAAMASIPATVIGDSDPEANETFHITITSVEGGASPGRTVGTGTIIDDDTTPAAGLSVGVGDAALVEGNAGSRSLVVPVTLSDIPGANVGVTYTVTAGSATYGKSAKVAGADFGGKTTGILTFKAGGTRTKAVTIPIWADTQLEPDETYTVTLTNPTGGVTIIRATGTGTIIDDDI